MPLPETFVSDFHDEETVSKMEYRPFGKTGLNVSKVSLGGGTFSDFYGFDEKESIATIHQAIKSGINYLDTAPYYGQGKSEEIYGKALKNIPRKAYYLATKVGRYERNIEKMFDFSAKKTRESVENSLKLLGVEYLDVVQIHDIEFADDLNLVINETLPVLEEFVRQGKVKFIGVSAYPLKALKEIMLAAPGRFNTVLCYSRFTLFDDSLKEYLTFFEEQNVAVICASGLGMGLLTNSGPQDWHPAPDQIKDMCKKARNICKDANIDLARLAIHHFMELDGPATFLTGMQTRNLLDFNLKSYYDGLTKTEQEIYKNLKETVFTNSVNWEGIELERYLAEKKSKK